MMSFIYCVESITDLCNQSQQPTDVKAVEQLLSVG